MTVATQARQKIDFKFRNLGRLFSDISVIDKLEVTKHETLSLMRLAIRLEKHCGRRVFGLSDGNVSVQWKFRPESEIVEIAKFALRAVYLFLDDGSRLEQFNKTYQDDTAVRKLLNDGTLTDERFGISLTDIVKFTFTSEFADRDESCPLERLAFLPCNATDEILNPAPILDVTNGNVVAARSGCANLNSTLSGNSGHYAGL